MEPVGRTECKRSWTGKGEEGRKSARREKRERRGREGKTHDQVLLVGLADGAIVAVLPVSLRALHEGGVCRRRRRKKRQLERGERREERDERNSQ